LKRGELILHNA